MSVLSTEEQALVDWLKSSIPRWLWMEDSAQEVWGAAAKGLIDVQTLIEELNLATYILTATGVWLEQHADDRGTRRQANEDDPTLRARLRNVPDAVNVQSLKDAANAILAAAGIVGTATLVELPRDGANTGTFTAMTGTGGTFALVSGTTYKFTPTVPLTSPPFTPATAVRLIQTWKLVIAGAATGGNNGTFVITGVDVNGPTYVNVLGAAGLDAGCTWTINKYDRRNNLLDGHGKSFCSRGFRASHAGRPGVIVIMLPYGTTAAVTASVREMLRQKKAGGIAAFVETRLNP